MARVHYPTNAGQAWAQREAIGGDARLASEMPILLKSRPQSQSTAWAQWHCTVDSSGQWPGTVDSGRHSQPSLLRPAGRASDRRHLYDLYGHTISARRRCADMS
jgi:hypothetical protein